MLVIPDHVSDSRDYARRVLREFDFDGAIEGKHYRRSSERCSYGSSTASQNPTMPTSERGTPAKK